MKLSPDETRAVAFVLGLVGLATAARLITSPRHDNPPAAPVIDAGVLEDSSDRMLGNGRARAKPLGAEERIDVNLASAQELDRLPGVGPGLAARIVEERERGGAFDSVADLRAVRGFGPALLSKIEAHLEFGFASGLGRRDRAASGQANPKMIGTASGATGTRSRASSRPDAGDPLDVNSATSAELDALPGVGPALAARIIAKRDSLHGFESVDDLRKVRGIGAATLERLRPFLRSQ